jgi:integration host factor subunit beta
VILPEIVREITEKHNLPYHVVNAIIRKIFQDMAACLGSGGRVEIRDFGIFSLRCRAERIARNPKTGENLEVPSKYIVHFKPGKELRERVNQGATAYSE